MTADIDAYDAEMMIPPLRQMMGPSNAVGKIISQVNRVARSDFTVVILGETGTGKELVARAIHHASTRSQGPFVPVDCGAIPETLLESELFGHEKGAFTGADKEKPGKFEAAEAGTLLLDEIPNMPVASQAKLLRVLQDTVVYRVGSTDPITVNVRLLVATNDDLETAVADGRFRHDLLYRLNEFVIRIPPLRQRKSDILYLANRFLDITNMELKKSVRGYSESALEMLTEYDWPGNARQLRSVTRRAVLLADSMITEEHIDLRSSVPPQIQVSPGIDEEEDTPFTGLSLKEIVRRKTASVEREVLMEALRKTGGNKAKAARLLKIDYKTIHSKLKRYGISVAEAAEV
jgi:two-component system nitrogen regulation response regulator GlnG